MSWRGGGGVGGVERAERARANGVGGVGGNRRGSWREGGGGKNAESLLSMNNIEICLTTA